MRRSLAPLVGLALCTGVAQADNWPAWRGATGQGYCEEKGIPVKWSAKENVKWKVALKYPGNSTPIIWGDKIFLTQANKDPNPKKNEKGKVNPKLSKDGTIRSLLCLSRADGKVLWQRDVEYTAFERNYGGITYGNASPVTDGERVVACYGSAGLYCYDFAGKELWRRTDLGEWQHQFGNGASPVLYGDLVIQWCGPNEVDAKGKGGRNYLIAVDKTNGKTVWQHDETYGSWSTPVIAKVDGKDHLILGQSRDMKNQPEARYGFLKGFDPASGKELWSCQGMNSYTYTSALCANGVAVGMSGFGGSAIAVKLGGTGDITKNRLWFHKSPANQRVGSGMIVGDYVYIIDENGIPRCYDLKTGENQWQSAERLSLTWGSMIHADGRLYVLMRNGDTVVLAASPNYDLIAVNSLRGEQTNSSLAVSDGEIFIRTFRNLYCISEKK